MQQQLQRQHILAQQQQHQTRQALLMQQQQGMGVNVNGMQMGIPIGNMNPAQIAALRNMRPVRMILVRSFYYVTDISLARWS